nr:hypothetical protein [uncultured Actinoplanes sp.]
MEKPELDEGQRSDAARIVAVIDELGAGDPADALPKLRTITSDRVLLGDVLGDYLHRVVVGSQADALTYWPAIELLRAAGADEDRAAAKAAWLRREQARA